MKIKPWYMPMVSSFGDDETEDIPMSNGLNVYEDSGLVHIEAPVPGVPSDKVEVTYTDGRIHIFAKHEESEEDRKKKSYIYKMERSSTFEYISEIPTSIDEKSIQAEVKDGVVHITAKVTEVAKPKKITVTSGK